MSDLPGQSFDLKGAPLMTSNPTDHTVTQADGGADMQAFWDQLEHGVAEAICKARPGAAEWRPFHELLSDSVDRALTAFPNVNRASLGFPFAQICHSPIDDALREVQAMFSTALEQQGISKEATKLLSDWIDYRMGATTVHFQFAALRARLDSEAPSSAD